MIIISLNDFTNDLPFQESLIILLTGKAQS